VFWYLLWRGAVDGELYRSLIIKFCLMLRDQDDPENRGYDQDQHAEWGTDRRAIFQVS
jgi:hypothetical protein